MDDTIRKQLFLYLKTEFADCLLTEKEQKENEKILNKVGFDKNSLIYHLYKRYDLDCFYFDINEVQNFLFDSLSFIGDLEDNMVYIHQRLSVPEIYIPISNGEAACYTFYNLQNHKVFFCDINLKDDIPENAERTWNNFEEFFIEYMNLQNL